MIRQAVRRLLRGAGLAPRADVERERQAAALIRTAERDRAARSAAAHASKLKSLEDKLRAAKDRAAAEHAERTTLAGILRHYLLRLSRTEAELAGRLTSERRVKLVQLAAGARSIRRKRSPAAAARAAQLASVSAHYAAATARWKTGDRPAGAQQVTIAGLRWSVPGDAGRTGSLSKRIVERQWLPIEDLASVRHFAVGGVMLDIGAHVGTTAITRVVLGDFARAYAVEADPDHYLCLVGNTLDNRLEGRVLPDRVAIVGRPAADDADGVPALTLDQWVERLRIPVDDVRFIRIAMRDLGVNPLEGAARLLERRQIVWQFEIAPGALRDDSRPFSELCATLGRHFTHVRELGGHAAPRLYAAAEAWSVLGALAHEYPPPNFLVFNLARSAARRDAADDDGAVEARRPVVPS